MNTSELTPPTETHRRLEPLTGISSETSLLEELCSSRAQLSDNESGGMPSHQSVPPTGITDGIGDACWIARTVYGPENPRWMLFREWLMSDAPAWFRRLYIRRGERFAQWITPHHGIKAVIRRWMDFIIERRGA